MQAKPRGTLGASRVQQVPSLVAYFADAEEYLFRTQLHEALWHRGLYTNEADPRIFVPKQNPWMGWTVNMGEFRRERQRAPITPAHHAEPHATCLSTPAGHPWGMPTLGAMIAAPLLVAAGAFVANKYRQPKL